MNVLCVSSELYFINTQYTYRYIVLNKSLQKITNVRHCFINENAYISFKEFKNKK